jgi:hypothetical protein
MGFGINGLFYCNVMSLCLKFNEQVVTPVFNGIQGDLNYSFRQVYAQHRSFLGKLYILQYMPHVLMYVYQENIISSCFLCTLHDQCAVHVF